MLGTEQSEWEAVIHTFTWRSKVTHAPLPAPSAFVLKKNMVGYFLIRPRGHKWVRLS